MRQLINENSISATTVDSVYDQVIDLLEARGYNTANNADEVINFLSYLEDVDLDDISSNDVQRIDLDGDLDGDWQKTIHVIIAENYVDPGSDDYVYTISVWED